MKDPAETLRHWGQTLGWLRARSSQLTLMKDPAETLGTNIRLVGSTDLMKDPAETLRHWGQTFDWLGGRLSPLSQCLSGSSPHPPKPTPFVPIVSMSQRVLPSSSKTHAVCPHCLNVSAGPSPHPPKATHAVCPHCLNVSAGPSPHPPKATHAVCPHCLNVSAGPSPHPPKATHAVCPHCLNVSSGSWFRALRLQPSKASTSPGAEKHLIMSYFRFNFLRPWFQLSNHDFFVYEPKSV